MAHALFPGSFDPPTLGHVDLLRRAAALFGRVTAGVAEHPTKRGLLAAEQRLELLRACTADVRGLEVVLLSGLVVAACEEQGCDVIVRGVRHGGEYAYEAQMAATNRVLLPRVDTVLLPSAPELAHVSSTLVRQIAEMGGDVSAFVPAPVAAALRERFR